MITIPGKQIAFRRWGILQRAGEHLIKECELKGIDLSKINVSLCIENCHINDASKAIDLTN